MGFRKQAEIKYNNLIRLFIIKKTHVDRWNSDVVRHFDISINELTSAILHA